MSEQIRPFIIILLLALIARGLLLASGSVSFHSDEAIVGLMARHILQGERPVFFYGQAYMGSLDAWLVAGAFRLFGESIIAIRLVQSAFYLLTVLTSYAVAWRFSGRITVAFVTGLLMALPVPLFTLYTTASLGGYGEMLLCGNLVLWLGFDVTHEYRRSWWRWLLLGIVAGIGWWSNGLIIIYALPIALLILRNAIAALRSRTNATLPLIAVALLGFLIGSAPWWVYNLEHEWEALAFYLPGDTEDGHVQYLPGLQTEPVTSSDSPTIGADTRALGLLLFGFPTLIGMRFPWASTYYLPLVGLVIAGVSCIALYTLARDSQHRLLHADGRLIVLLMLSGLCAIMILTSFGADPTGRYLLPLALPLSITFGAFIARIGDSAFRSKCAVQVGLIGAVLLYNASSQITAATTYPGFTVQFDAITHIPNEYDAALIAFLEEQQLTTGYTQYWVTYRLAFLSDERLIFAPLLPYKTTLIYRIGDNRYPAYVDIVEQVGATAYITANQPELDQLLLESFAAQNIRYQQQRIGPYTIYYSFTPSLLHPGG